MTAFRRHVTKLTAVGIRQLSVSSVSLGYIESAEIKRTSSINSSNNETEGVGLRRTYKPTFNQIKFHEGAGEKVRSLFFRSPIAVLLLSSLAFPQQHVYRHMVFLAVAFTFFFFFFFLVRGGKEGIIGALAPSR